MKIVQDTEVRNFGMRNVTACIGTFDGMHLGHQELLKQAYTIGNEEYIVITFNEMPQRILKDKNYKYMINKLEKEKLLIAQHATGIVYFDFEQIKDVDPESFCKILNEKYGINKIVVGEDFKFGKDRTGDIEFLKGYFNANNVSIIPDKLVNGSRVSSSTIRNCLKNGDMSLANKLLGRPYSVYGQVIKGDGVGTELGFPTANLKIDNNYRLPKNGVYAATVLLDSNIASLPEGHRDKEYSGMVNIGFRPTLGNTSKTLHIEINIFDFDLSIYDYNLTLKFYDFLREEIKFDNLEGLSKQLIKDKQAAIKNLNLKH